jgi:CRP-like cAMP-binding protein
VEDAHLLRRGVFAGFSDSQLARLVTSGAWKNIDPGTVLTRQGEQVKELVLLCNGNAIVKVDDTIVAQLSDGAFVGEMAFVTGNPASATVVVGQPTRAFVFDMIKLRKLVQGDDSVAVAIHRVVGRDLAAKLKLQNEQDVSAISAE